MTALSTDPPSKYRSVINLSQRERAPVNEISDTCRGKVLNGERVIKRHAVHTLLFNNSHLVTLLWHVCLHSVFQFVNSGVLQCVPIFYVHYPLPRKLIQLSHSHFFTLTALQTAHWAEL